MDNISLTDINFRIDNLNKIVLLIVFLFLRRVQAEERKDMIKQDCMYACLHPNEK